MSAASTPTKKTGTGFAVRCADFTTKPHRDREAAERILAQIERMGECALDHEVVEVSR